MNLPKNITKIAYKVMHMAAIAYKVKKYLKFITKTAKSGARSLVAIILNIKSLFGNYNGF